MCFHTIGYYYFWLIGDEGDFSLFASVEWNYKASDECTTHTHTHTHDSLNSEIIGTRSPFRYSAVEGDSEIRIAHHKLKLFADPGKYS